MKSKLIFVPYQDSDNFLNDGILTREFAMLYLLSKEGCKKIINVKKPRTILDKKQYQTIDSYFPEGTVEGAVKKILEQSDTIQYQPIASLEQIIKRRCWWITGYERTIELLKKKDLNDCLVYSDNPFAAELLAFLSQKGAKLYFDVMDNFAIHPSLSSKEQEQALRGYKKIFTFADVISANSKQTCEYMSPLSLKKIELVKNGVFISNELSDLVVIDQLRVLIENKKKYKKCIGYIGKIGQRLNAELIKNVSEKCKDYLFVFVGSYLKGQINQKLIKLFEEDNNVLHIDSIPSAYVYAICDQFDILTIPHACGKSENGGDPLKLYQYMTRKKPIITTPILGVDEFKDIICISNSEEEWVNFLNTPYVCVNNVPKGIAWEDRIAPIINKILK